MSAWPPRDVVAKLVESTEHLLQVHDCDHQGWEEVDAALRVAKEYLLTPADDNLQHDEA